MKITVKHILVLLGVCAMLPICAPQQYGNKQNRQKRTYGKGKNTVRDR